jgi:O-antigen ligase
LITANMALMHGIDGTFGNPSILAAYMLFNIFIATYMWTKTWDGFLPNKQTAPSIAYATVIVLDMIILLFTGTRGAILGLVVGGIITLLIFAFLGSRRAYWIAGAAIVGAIVLASSLAQTDRTSLVRKVGFIDRLASISFTDFSAQSRILYIKMAWQGVKERPIFGWGQENYSIVYGKYFEARVHTFDAWSDRVGNIIFDQLIAGGFMGLFAYLSVFATVLGILWQRNAFCLSERALLSGLFAAYLFQNLFFHDSTASYILFGTVLAYIVRRSYRGTRSPMENRTQPRRGDTVAILPALRGQLRDT